jgi:hypothetical protein
VRGERLHSDELPALYSLPNIIWVVKSGRMRWSGHVARLRGRRGGGPEGKRQLGRPMYTWENNIKPDLRELRWGGMACIYLARGRDRWLVPVNAVLKLRVPLKFAEFFGYLTTC